MHHPDGYTGGAMAVQGIRDATVLLHGRRGCRTGLLEASSGMARGWRDPLPDIPFYRGERTAPYSGVTLPDCSDGSSQTRYDSALEFVSSEGYGLVVSMYSPGISVVGDDLRGGSRIMTCDPDSLGDDVQTGFDRMNRAILERFEPSGIVPGTVAVVGLGIMQKDWQAVRRELEHVLGGAGLKVVCCTGAGCTLDQMRESLSAEYVLDVCPDYSRETRALHESLGSGIVGIGHAPVGFDSVSDLFDAVQDRTGACMDRARNMLRGNIRRAYDCVTMSGVELTGTSFSVDAVSSIRDPLTAWLESSLGMVEVPEDPEVLFAPGYRAILAERSGQCEIGVDIGFPSPAVDFVKRPVLGMDGALYILDSLFSRRNRRTPPRGASSRGYGPS